MNVSLFIHSLVDRHVSFSSNFFVIINKAPMNILAVLVIPKITFRSGDSLGFIALKHTSYSNG